MQINVWMKTGVGLFLSHDVTRLLGSTSLLRNPTTTRKIILAEVKTVDVVNDWLVFGILSE